MINIYSTYNFQLEKAIRKIEYFHDEDLCIEQLAHISGYSNSHFQQLFKEYTGECVAKYIKRIRVEKSAFMLKYQYKKIIDAAMRTGFNSNTSFTRAFKSYYNISPLEFKQRHQYFDNRIETPDYKIVKLDNFKVIFTRAYGDFNTSTYSALKEANIYFKDIIDDETEYITMCHGEPTICRNFNKLKYDACILFNKNKHFNVNKFPSETIKGGTYAKFTFKGTFNDFDTFYYKVYETFFHNKSYQISLRPAFQVHHNSFDDLINGNTHADILIPIDL